MSSSRDRQRNQRASSQSRPHSPVDTVRQLGYDENFTPDLEKKYTCPVCLAALRNAMQTKCGHRFCKQCLRGVMGNRRFSKCPVDNTWFDTSADVFDDNAVRREVLSLKVRCRNAGQGCKWSGELRQLEAHINDCPYLEITCPNACGVKLLNKDVTTHMVECPKRPLPCQHCNEMVTCSELTKHQLLLCMKFPVNCVVCGETGILREDIPKHVNLITGDCPLVTVTCKYQHVGCIFQDRRKNMPAHLRDSVDHHMMLLTTRLVLQDEKIKLHANEFQKMRELCVQRELEIKSQQELIQKQSDRLQSLQEHNLCGKLLWRAPAGEDCLKSPSFYTGQPGYKFSVLLKPTGITAEDGSYASLYVIMEKGCYDDNLNFPFNGTCQVTIFDQSQDVGARQHFSTAIMCNNVSRVREATEDCKRGRAKLMKSDKLLGDKFVCNGSLAILIDINPNTPILPVNSV